MYVRVRHGRRQAGPASRIAGLSLLELVVALAVVAVLVTFAMPAFRGQQLRARRAEAVTALLAVAVQQERAYARDGRYQANLTAGPPAGLGLPAETPGGRFQITLRTTPDGSGFVATADAAGDQVADSRCLSFEIDESGRRSATRPECLRP
jgi:type IV pilus assembly protein PilE